MSYSSAVSLDYQPYDFSYINPPTLPLLTGSSSAAIIDTNNGALTNSETGGVAVPFTSASFPMATGIWAIRFQLSLTLTANVSPINIYMLIQPANGSAPISNCVMNSGDPVAGTYDYSIDMVISIIGSEDSNTVFQVVGFWNGAGTIQVNDINGCSYVKLA